MKLLVECEDDSTVVEGGGIKLGRELFISSKRVSICMKNYITF